MSRRSSWRKAARPKSGRTRTHSANSNIGRSLYRRPLRLEPLEDRRLLALVTVNTLSDTVDFNDGVTSLREAIFVANTVPGADSIEFAPALTAAGPATIALKHGEFEITEALSIDGPGLELVTLDAQTQSRIFNITATVGDFEIAGITLTNGLLSGDEATVLDTAFSGGAIRSLTAGNLAISNCVLRFNRATGERTSGGGVYSAGDVFVSNCEIDSNQSLEGGGIYSNASAFISNSIIVNNVAFGSSSGHGGGVSGRSGIQVNGSVIRDNSAKGEGGGIVITNLGDVVVTNSVIDRNNANRGGGIAARSFIKSVQVNQCILTNNSASKEGGGIYSNGSEVIVQSSLILGNNSIDGGGIANSFTTYVNDSAVIGNVATGGGGGVYGGFVRIARSTFANNDAGVDGGGSSGRRTEITESTFSGNSAGGRGAAVFDNFQVDITRSTMTNNSANGFGGGMSIGALVMRDSIVAGNFSQDGSSDVHRNQSFEPHVSSSIIGDGSGLMLAEAPLGSPDANGNLIGGPTNGRIDPLLGPLANNGGLTQTHALLPGSPAINAGDPAALAGVDGVPEFDQRGGPWSRVADGRIDSGAVESQSNPLQGDYNFNGVVDAADCTVWRDTLNSVTDLRADGNGDGKIEALDYEVWKNNFGALAPDLGGNGQEQVFVTSEEATESVALNQGEPPAEPGADGRSRVGSASVVQPPALPGVKRGRGHSVADGGARQDRALEVWWATRSRRKLELFEVGTAKGWQDDTGNNALDCALAELGRLRLAVGN